MKKIILRKIELLLNNENSKEQTVEYILEHIEDYSKRFIIFADKDENKDIVVLDELYTKFDKYYEKTTDVSGNEKFY